MTGFLLQADHQLFFQINNGVGHPYLDPVFLFFTWLGAWPIGLIAFSALRGDGRRVLWRRHVPVLIMGALALGLVNRGIKKTVRAPRPGKAYRTQLAEGTVEIRFLEKKVPMRKSFPSGHSATAFFFMFYVALSRDLHAYWALPLAMLIALSRVYVGAHFPIDCLAGAVLGSFAGWLAWRVYQRWPLADTRVAP